MTHILTLVPVSCIPYIILMEIFSSFIYNFPAFFERGKGINNTYNIIYIIHMYYVCNVYKIKYLNA